MLEKIAVLYRKAEMGIISGLAGTTENVAEESCFYDTGYMQAQIGRMQKEIAGITKELQGQLELKEDSDAAKTRVRELMECREQLLFRMIFLASNSFGNLPDCLRMAEGHGFVFMQCVHALRAYQEGKKEEAFRQMEAYYREHGSVEGHFLINKVFGLLLAERGQEEKAAAFLSYALQYVPDDEESLTALKACCHRTGKAEREALLDEILAVLG